MLHNFAWHQNFTWSDRGGNVAGRLARFHLANGAISLLGNLALMRLLVGSFGLPLLPASLVTISACFVSNFLAADRMVFLTKRRGIVEPASCRHEARAGRPRDSRRDGGTAYSAREWASPMSSTVRCEKGT